MKITIEINEEELGGLLEAVGQGINEGLKEYYQKKKWVKSVFKGEIDMDNKMLKGLIHLTFCIYFIMLLFLTTIYSETMMFLIINVTVFGSLALFGYTPDWLVERLNLYHKGK